MRKFVVSMAALALVCCFSVVAVAQNTQPSPSDTNVVAPQPATVMDTTVQNPAPMDASAPMVSSGCGCGGTVAAPVSTGCGCGSVATSNCCGNNSGFGSRIGNRSYSVRNLNLGGRLRGGRCCN